MIDAAMIPSTIRHATKTPAPAATASVSPCVPYTLAAPSVESTVYINNLNISVSLVGAAALLVSVAGVAIVSRRFDRESTPAYMAPERRFRLDSAEVAATDPG